MADSLSWSVQRDPHHVPTTLRSLPHADNGALLGVWWRRSADGPDVIAYPPAGFVPVSVFTENLPGATDALNWSVSAAGLTGPVTASVTRVGDGSSLGVRVLQLPDAPSPAFGFAPQGWSPVAGETYRVTFSGGATVSYEVTPIACD